MFSIKSNEVLVVPCKNYDREEMAAAYAEIFKYFNKDKLSGKSVYIKPNILKGDAPEKASVTHPEVVYHAAKYFVDAGCDVQCGDSPNFITAKKMINSIYKTTGIPKAIEEAGGSMDSSSKGTSVKGGEYLPEFKMLTNIRNSDIVINIAKAKTHSFTGYTGAVKNLFGVIPGPAKPELHLTHPNAKSFTNVLIDICETVKADLHIVDAVIGMEGPGPSSGVPKKLGAIIAGTNPYAVDEVVIELMGIKKGKIQQVNLARLRGLTDKLENIKILGANLKDIKSGYPPFRDAVLSSASYWKVLAFLLPMDLFMKAKKKPYVQPNCVSCGVCAEACPPNAITIEDKAVIDYSKCIKCYCCQELCPARAIVIGKKRNDNRKTN